MECCPDVSLACSNAGNPKTLVGGGVLDAPLQAPIAERQCNDETASQTKAKNRLPGYNYGSAGAYFITICAKEKQCLFGKRTELSSKGCLVRQQIEKMAQFYPDICIEKYVIMPNHVHLLLVVDTEQPFVTPANGVIPQFISTLKRFSNKLAGEDLWQRSYHDHIIRNEEDYRRIWQYIDTNPVKWNEDRYFIEE